MRSRDRLLTKLFSACRKSRHPSQSLSDAISKHLVVKDWADDDPRWEHFAWPNWLANEASAENLIRWHLGVKDFGKSAAPPMRPHSELFYATGWGLHVACSGHYPNAAKIGAAIKLLSYKERNP